MIKFETNEPFPTINEIIIKEAITKHYLPQQYKGKLIKNPNNCPLFFMKFDLNSSNI